MNLCKLKHLSVSSIVLTSFLMSSHSLQASNLEEENEKNLQLQQMIPKKNDELALSAIEKKMGGVLVKFEDIEKNIETSLQKQTFLLGQSFIEKVQNEEDKKKLLIEETEKGIGEKSKNLLSIKGKIKEQTGYVSNEIKHISTFLDDKNGIAISGSLKNRLGKEVSRGINGFTNKLGIPSQYHDETKYNDYYLIKTSDLNNICSDISQSIISIHNFYQTLDGIWNEAGTIVSKAENARGLIYSNSDSFYNILKEYGGDWYVKLKSKVNDADNYVINVRDIANQILSKANSIKSTVSSLESNVSNIKSKILQKQESPTVIKEYGDFLIYAILNNAKQEEANIENNVVSSINQSLDDYFAKGKEYSDKMESLKRNTDKIEGHVKNIDIFSNELDTVSNEVINFTKNQTGKISLHHNSLIDKGKEFDQEARTIIEKNREVSLGVIKGKTSEMLMAAKSLAFMVSDKQDQVESYKEQLKDTGETFKHHEGVLIVQHDKHLEDVKGGKQEVLAEKEKLFFEKQNAVQKLENKTIQLENELKQYQVKTNDLNLQIAKFSGESQMIDGTLKGMLMMMGVNMLELNDLSGPMLAQKCFAKYLETKK